MITLHSVSPFKKIYALKGIRTPALWVRATCSAVELSKQISKAPRWSQTAALWFVATCTIRYTIGACKTQSIKRIMGLEPMTRLWRSLMLPLHHILGQCFIRDARGSDS